MTETHQPPTALAGGPGGFSRRTAMALGAGGAMAAVLSACGLGRASSPDRPAVVESSSWGGTLLDPPFEKPDVTFTDMNGKSFPFKASTEGRLTVLFFGYTHCPDVCPTYLNSLASALDGIGTGAGSRPLVLFVGVDVARDTPAVMKTYLGNIDPEFVGLTGPETAIADAVSALKLPPVVIYEPNPDGTYEVGHPAQVTVFSPDNTAHRIYSAMDTRPQQWAKDLPRLDEGEFK